MIVHGLLAKLVALANRPGTVAEGTTARSHAERLAARHGLELVETHDGQLIAMDAFHADLLRRLQEIAERSAGNPPVPGARRLS